MENLEKYRQWLRARGFENPSDEEVTLFSRKAKRTLQRSHSLLELLLCLWMNAKAKHSGTRSWLRFEGLLDPSEDDLDYYGRKIRRAILWRLSLLCLLLGVYLVFVWHAGLPPFRQH